MHACMYCMYAYVYMCVYVCVCMCMYVCVYIGMYIYAYVHTHACMCTYNIHVRMCSYCLYNYFTACDLSTFCPVYSHFDFKLKLEN